MNFTSPLILGLVLSLILYCLTYYSKKAPYTYKLFCFSPNGISFVGDYRSLRSACRVCKRYKNYTFKIKTVDNTIGQVVQYLIFDYDLNKFKDVEGVNEW